MGRIAWAAILLSVCCFVGTSLAAEPKITQTEKGAVIETDRYKAEISAGVMVSFINKFTGEEYLDKSTDLAKIQPHLPSGLGTQNGEDCRAGADRLFHWPWWEHDPNETWPSQHYATAASVFSFAAKDASSASLTYKGLTDGKASFADETYALNVVVEAETGDLVITPAVESPRKGVYGCALTVTALQPAVTIEAPIFDGVRLDRKMQHMLWINSWGGYWDYSFLAMNGNKIGAVGVWCQDAQLRTYKHLFYLINEQGLSFSLSAMNVPPFEESTKASPIAWRFQAFDKSWSQAAARFRDWRLKNVKIAPRADWTRQVSFVNMGVNANKAWLDTLSAYLENTHLERTVTFAPIIRRQPFDVNHADNMPYEGDPNTKKPSFKEDMVAWKASGARLMAYLQPMIMWAPKPVTDREKDAVEFHKRADTCSVFQKVKGAKVDYVEQHHLGQPDWQKWFLTYVKEYIQDNGADGVYHDQAYHCPLDDRGLAINNMTSTEGMADYFYKAQEQNPGSIHGTEHMIENNNVGASLGIGSGILWGTAASMRHQRIEHASPVTNALHYPNGTIMGFPHYSDIAAGGGGSSIRFHWGMDLMEKRGDIPGLALQNTTLYSGKAVPFDKFRNELWLDRTRAMLFVTHGLRPVYPEDFSREVYTYFKGAEGQGFRYECLPWGSRFVEVKGDKKITHYARIHGVTDAAVDGAIDGWVVYKPVGPAGLNPSRYYIVDPNAKRPAVYFQTSNKQSSSFYESYAEDGAANEKLAFLKVRGIPQIGVVTRFDSVILHSPVPPKAIFVNGQPQALQRVKDGNKELNQYSISFESPADIAVVVQEPPAGFAAVNESSIVRTVSVDTASDFFDSNWLTSRLTCSSDKTGREMLNARIDVPMGAKVTQIHTALKMPGESNQPAGLLKISFTGNLKSAELNGIALRFTQDAGKPAMISIPAKPGQVMLLSTFSDAGGVYAFEFLNAAQLKAIAPVQADADKAIAAAAKAATQPATAPALPAASAAPSAAPAAAPKGTAAPAAKPVAQPGK